MTERRFAHNAATDYTTCNRHLFVDEVFRVGQDCSRVVSAVVTGDFKRIFTRGNESGEFVSANL